MVQLSLHSVDRIGEIVGGNTEKVHARIRLYGRNLVHKIRLMINEGTAHATREITNGSLEQADATDIPCANRVMVQPWRQYFAVFPVDIKESEHLLSDEALDIVQGITDRPFHDSVSQREEKAGTKRGRKWKQSSLDVTNRIPPYRGYWTTWEARRSPLVEAHPPTVICPEASPEMGQWATWKDLQSRI